MVLTFSKKSIVTLYTRFQAQLLIPMFKNFRALEILRKVFPAIELVWKIFSRGIFIAIYSFVSLLMLFLIGGLGYAGLLHLWKMF